MIGGSTFDIVFIILAAMLGVVIGIIAFWIYQDGRESRVGRGKWLSS